jgi:hypothetical protein
MVAVDTDNRQIALIELFADRQGGHWVDNLVLLAKAAKGLGLEVTVVAPPGLVSDAEKTLTSEGIVIASSLGVGVLSWLYSTLARALDRCSAFVHSLNWDQKLYFDLWLMHRCFAEAAALKAANNAVRGKMQTKVILSASESFAALTARIGGSHIRFVHELDSPCGVIHRALDRIFIAPQRVTILCPTEAIKCRLQSRNPHLRYVVQNYAARNDDMYIREEERAAARLVLSISPHESVGCLVGGWWPTKDIETVRLALATMLRHFTLIIGGAPLDTATLASIRDTINGKLIEVDHELRLDELRLVYAASDFTIVSRRPGVYKESGLTMDAARYGVSLMISNHDPALSRKLRDLEWVRIFATGDWKGLGALLDSVIDQPLPRPTREAAKDLGMLTAEMVVQRLLSIGNIAA